MIDILLPFGLRRPFPVDMLDVVRADFAGDNVGCWMQIQVREIRHPEGGLESTQPATHS